MADSQQYDLTIIGSGPGGYVAAIRAAQLGLKTAMVEKATSLGGTCLLVGCIPTKALLHSADVLVTAREASRFGVSTGEVKLDLAGVHKHKTSIVRRLSKGVEFLMKKNAITVINGHGRLKGPGRVEVTAPQGRAQTLHSKHVILATGSVAKMLPGLKVDSNRVITSTEALSLEFVPRNLLILGAGAVGMEFASIYARFGSTVTVVEMLPRVLPFEDEEISTEMQKAFKKRGIGVLTGTKVTDVKVQEKGVEVAVESARGGKETIKADDILNH